MASSWPEKLAGGNKGKNILLDKGDYLHSPNVDEKVSFGYDLY